MAHHANLEFSANACQCYPRVAIGSTGTFGLALAGKDQKRVFWMLDDIYFGVTAVNIMSFCPLRLALACPEHVTVITGKYLRGAGGD